MLCWFCYFDGICCQIITAALSYTDHCVTEQIHTVYIKIHQSAELPHLAHLSNTFIGKLKNITHPLTCIKIIKSLTTKQQVCCKNIFMMNSIMWKYTEKFWTHSIWREVLEHCPRNRSRWSDFKINGHFLLIVLCSALCRLPLNQFRTLTAIGLLSLAKQNQSFCSTRRLHQSTYCESKKVGKMLVYGY